jgi:hypothetical protein
MVRVAWLWTLAAATACGAAVPPLPGKGGPAWTELTSEHFTVWTDGDREQVRDLVGQMEQLRQVIVGVTFPSLPNGRTLVVALRDEDELAAFSSTAQARAYTVLAGIPLWQPMIALSAHSRVQDTDRTVAHELTHVVSLAAVHHQPRWLAEGMAEFFQTVRLDVRGGTADVGGAPEIRGRPMRMAHLIPVERLFAWRDITADEDRQYSTAWALFTYLINTHRDELLRYLQLLHDVGKPRDEATAEDAAQLWQAAFRSLPLADVDSALRQWLIVGHHEVMHFTVQWREWSVTERALGDADVHAARGMLCALVAHRPDEARADAAAALAVEPGNVLARLTVAGLDHAPVTAEQARVMTEAHGEDWRAWWLAAIALSHDHADTKQIANARITACGLFAQNAALVAPSKLCDSEPARGTR